MTTKDYPNGKIITLSQGLASRPKLAHVYYFIIFMIAGAGTLRYFLINADPYNRFLFIALMLIPATFFFAAYRFAIRIVKSEKLIVTKNIITLVNGSLWIFKKRTYDIRQIENFRYLPEHKKLKHPRYGIITDNRRLAFDYKGLTIKFGEAVYSWEFEQLEVILYDITGNDLRYTDSFESTFNAQQNS